MRFSFGVNIFLTVIVLAFGPAYAQPVDESFHVNSVSAAPAATIPGQSVDFSTSVTTSQNVSGYTVGLQVYKNRTYFPQASNLFTGLSFRANVPVTERSSWIVPTGTAPGSYEILAGVFDSNWKWITGTTAQFTVGSATGGSGGGGGGSGGGSGNGGGGSGSRAVNGVCGLANGAAVASGPRANLCGTGSASAVTGSGPWRWTCAGSAGGTTASCTAPVYTAAIEAPGVYAPLSASPPYVCVTNYYVDGAAGSDSNPGTYSSPWKTIQNADTGSHVPTPGECVNVFPGTYQLSRPIYLGRGGNRNTTTGFVVYRSTVPQGAHLVASSNIGNLLTLLTSYVVIDGFEIDGNNSITSGHGIDGCQSGHVAHHFVAINNIIHDMGGSGLNTCNADFITWMHNVVYRTSSTSPYQVSGIDVWQPRALAAGSFTPTAADATPFGIVIAYNIARDNFEGPAISGGHTDGNGIIIDSTLGSSTCSTCGTPYNGNILVLGNLTYGNGGGGVHLFLSQNVTVANNTSYNNYLDLRNSGTARGELSNGGSQHITWVNNVAYAVPGSGVLTNNRPIVNFSLQNFSDSGSWSKNIAFGASVSTDVNNVIDPAKNLVGVNPQLTNPAAGNFVPLAGSPAIGAGLPESFIPSPTPDIGAYSLGAPATH